MLMEKCGSADGKLDPKKQLIFLVCLRHVFALEATSREPTIKLAYGKGHSSRTLSSRQRWMTMAGSWWVKALNPNGVRVRSYQLVWQTYLRLGERNHTMTTMTIRMKKNLVMRKLTLTLIVTRPLDFFCFGSGVVHGLA